MGLLVCPLIDCLCLESFSRICSKAPLGMMVQKLVGTLASPRKWPELPCTMGPQLVLFDFPLLNSFPTMSYSKKKGTSLRHGSQLVLFDSPLLNSFPTTSYSKKIEVALGNFIMEQHTLHCTLLIHSQFVIGTPRYIYTPSILPLSIYSEQREIVVFYCWYVLC